ncbi:hypothetical protein QN277_001511 [Acacia crassicarpa]|uniref:AB hydrolase-1 domain-containing protein n=1 Tax=Acacia crassicarpa TaxID=499986 RepID=A0AAE1N8U1_9FABA|nr:hypothetical protein QN277_001511 [Acacia crassicarpa]
MRISIIVMFRALLRMVMKMVGMRPQKVEIDQQGTVINFWVPSKPQNKKLAVVFLHGFAADGILTWQFQVMALARKYAVYVPDLVFFGESTTERPERSPEFQAECVAEGLKKLGVVEKWRVVGFSYGGIVGFKMAEMYSDMVVSVVVSGSTTELMESFSRPTLQKLGGFSSWSQLLLPRTADGVRVLLDVGIYKRIPYPIFFLREFLEEFICVNRRKKDELLAAVVKNIDSAIPKYPQVRAWVTENTSDMGSKGQDIRLGRCQKLENGIRGESRTACDRERRSLGDVGASFCFQLPPLPHSPFPSSLLSLSSSAIPAGREFKFQAKGLKQQCV